MNGFSVSLDDFGVGFTNINQLAKLPVSEVKVNRSLISNIHLYKFQQIIVNTLIEFNQELGFSRCVSKRGRKREAYSNKY